MAHVPRSTIIGLLEAARRAHLAHDPAPGAMWTMRSSRLGQADAPQLEVLRVWTRTPQAASTTSRGLLRSPLGRRPALDLAAAPPQASDKLALLTG